MDRRHFLKTTTGAAMAGALAGTVTPSLADEPRAKAAPGSRGVSDYTAAEHRRRMENIARCRQAVRACMRQHLITDYLPAQCCYNLGEYPATQPWKLEAYDEEELDRLRDAGVQLIQWFDDWADPLRLFGGDKYTPASPANVRRFVEMVHQRGMKLIPYASSGFLQRTDPEFRSEWAREGDNLVLGYWNMAHCSPASPGWRAYLLSRIARILDDYGADGIYIDGGYVANFRKRLLTPTTDEVAAFEETPEVDGAFADLLALIYGEVKRRGGIMKLHVDAADAPRSGGLKVYDYLWVGEGVGSADGLRETTKNYPPYIVPCIDEAVSPLANEDEPYLQAIPYMQFPILHAGKPVTGERGVIAGVAYPAGGNDYWMERCRQIREFAKTHPQGPYSYSLWDAFPGRPTARQTYARWFALYRSLVEEGTWAWLELGDSSLVAQPLPAGVVASVFANRELYLVLANYGQETARVQTTDAYVATDTPSAVPSRQWSLPQRSLAILRRTV